MSETRDLDSRKRKDINEDVSSSTTTTTKHHHHQFHHIESDDIVKKTNNMLIDKVDESFKIGLIFGQGGMGQLGLGESIYERKKPATIPSTPFGGANLLQLVCGGMHTVALTESHQVYTWGCNDDYALGRETNDNQPENIPCGVVLSTKYTPIKIAAGDSHTAVLTECGSVFVCGMYRDSERKIGLVTKDTHEKFLTLIYEKTNEKGSHAVNIASGNDHLLILTANGRIYSCGSGQQGQLGRVAKAVIEENGGRRGFSVFFEPALVPFVCHSKNSKRIKKIKTPVVDIICGSFHSFAIDRDGNVYGWGLNNYGQLGIGNVRDSKGIFSPSDYADSSMNEIDSECLIVYRPLLIGSISYFSSKTHIPKIAAGQHHTIFIDTTSNEVYGVGRAEYGRLGIGENKSHFYIHPQKTNITNITNNENDTPINCACGEVTSFIVGKLGNLYSYGMGSNLQLALNDDSDCLIPTKATGKQLSESDGVVGVSSGGQHTTLLVRKKTT